MKIIQQNGQLDVTGANVCGIYGFKFPDSKWLVGYSTNILNRVVQYVSNRKSKHKSRSGNLVFRGAVEKYGWPTIEVYVLEECPNDKLVLLKQEREWSNKLDSHRNGYNVMPCGIEKWEKSSTVYGPEFRCSVSKAMKEYHRKRKLEGKGSYNKKLGSTPPKLTAQILPTSST